MTSDSMGRFDAAFDELDAALEAKIATMIREAMAQGRTTVTIPKDLLPPHDPTLPMVVDGRMLSDIDGR